MNDPQVIQAIALVGILICNIVVLTAVVVIALKLSKTVSDVSEKGQTAIKSVQKQIDDIANLIKPTVSNARKTVTGVSDTVTSVQRQVKTTEGIMKQVAAPAALAIFAARVLRLNGMVVGALGFAAGMFAKQQMEGKKIPSRIALPPHTPFSAPVETAVVEKKTYDTGRDPLVTTFKNGTENETKPPVLSGIVEK